MTGIAPATLFRWLKNPGFKESYAAARRDALGAAIAGLQRASGQAVAVLVEIMNDAEAKHNARVSAACAVLDYGMRGIELEDIMSRITKLENKEI